MLLLVVVADLPLPKLMNPEMVLAVAHTRCQLRASPPRSALVRQRGELLLA
jgi:hypothetical protein